MRPAWAPMRRPHASQPLATSRALALALVPAPAQPARPSSGAGCVPSVCADSPEPAVRARAFPAFQTACRPSRLPLLSGAARSVASPANRLSFWQPRDRRAATPTRDPARADATVGRCLPVVRACQVWGLGVQHRRRNLIDCPPFSLHTIRFRVAPGRRYRPFLPGSAETLPQVVLRNQIVTVNRNRKRQ
jgi:hypothetical protein